MARKITLLFFIVLYPSFCYLNNDYNKKLKSAHSFFSLAYYHLYDKNIPNNLLQESIKTYNGLGDKNLAKELILQNFFSKHTSSNDDEVFFDITTLDLSMFNLPTTSNYPPDNLINLLRFYLLNEFNSYDNKVVFFPIEEIINNAISLTPNISKIIFSDHDLPCDSLYLNLYNNFKNDPAELKLFIKYFEDSYENFTINNSNLNREKYFEIVEEAAIKNFPIIPYLFDCQNLENEIRVKTTPVYFNIKSIEEVFERLLNRKPSLEEISFYEKIISKEDATSVKIVYYLVMISEEYKYY